MKRISRELFLNDKLKFHPVGLKLAQFISKMGPTSAYFSVILYDDGANKNFLVKKEGFPFVELDWMIYSCMRTWARTIITSGITFRT